ncbi:MAG: Crp/Fnr family transcriptional regulator [Solirubrobacterales bacterium]
MPDVEVRDEGAEITALLGRIPLFAELSADQLARIARVAVPRSHESGMRIFQEGDEGTSCYIVREGRCRVTRQHPDGRVITLATFGPGEFFGELSMIDGEVRSASVEALEPTELLALPASEMRAVLRDNVEITLQMVIALTRRIREANERISRQSFQTVPSRVAGVLARLTADETNGSPEQVTVRMTQADLAQLAGTSRESVSRFLAILERDGVIAVGRGRVTVLDRARLDGFVY